MSTKLNINKIVEETTKEEIKDLIDSGYIGPRDAEELYEAGVVGNLQERLLAKCNLRATEEVKENKVKSLIGMVINKTTKHINSLANRESQLDKDMHDAKRSQIKSRLNRTLELDKQ